MATVPAIQFKIRIDDRSLSSHILRFAQRTGRTVMDVSREVFKGMVRDALRFTPPSNSKASGPAAKRAGEQAIARDLTLIGFQPVKIKGYRVIRTAFGRPIHPVKVRTKINPKFADPDLIHKARLASKHGGRVTRGGKQAYYVDRAKFKTMRVRLFAEVGRLAAGWARAAIELGVSVPLFIKRQYQAYSRGTSVQIQRRESHVIFTVINNFPPGSEREAEETERRIGIFKQYRINALARQLKAQLAGLWKSTAR